jgi:hypothetical protein
MNDLPACKEPGCDRAVNPRTGGARGLCHTHYRRLKRAEDKGATADLSAPIRIYDGGLDVEVTIRVGMSMLDRIDQKAEDSGTNRNAVLRDAFEAWVKATQGGRKLPRAMREALKKYPAEELFQIHVRMPSVTLAAFDRCATLQKAERTQVMRVAISTAL